MLKIHAGTTPSTLGNKILEQVDEYKYFGQAISVDPNQEQEIQH